MSDVVFKMSIAASRVWPEPVHKDLRLFHAKSVNLSVILLQSLNPALDALHLFPYLRELALSQVRPKKRTVSPALADKKLFTDLLLAGGGHDLGKRPWCMP